MSEHHEGDSGRYPQVVRAVTETPWAILPSKLAAIIELVALRADGHRFTEEEIQARIGAGPPRKETQTVGTIALLPLYGVIVPRADIFSEMSGGTSVQRFQGAFRDAVEDDNISGIVIDVDSPGGQVDLVPELAEEIRSSRGVKPIVAVSNTLAASAAYWIAAQADEFVCTPSGEVGSIGVFAAHDDISKLQEQLGIKTTLVSAGKFKTELSPFEPLSDEARKALQARIDECYDLFVNDVAAGRGVSADTVRKGFGQGRVVTAKMALQEGMIDRIDTLEGAVGRMITETRSGRTARDAAPPPVTPTSTEIEAAASGLSFADEAEAARDAAAGLVNRTQSLAELRRGRLTTAKRDRLTACAASFRDATVALDELLAQTDPNRHRADLERERIRYEHARATL